MAKTKAKANIIGMQFVKGCNVPAKEISQNDSKTKGEVRFEIGDEVEPGTFSDKTETALRSMGALKDIFEDPKSTKTKATAKE